MMTCRELDALLAPYVDGEIAGGECERIEAHLRVCEPCRVRAGVERAARRLVRAHASALVPSASDSLRRRCAEAVSDHHAAQAAVAEAGRAGHGRGWMLSLAASLFLGLVGALFYTLSDSDTVLAAQLALDHLKCFSIPGSVGHAVSAPDAEGWFASQCGWKLKVPPTSAADDLVLENYRRCLNTGGLMAHVQYRWQAKPISLFVLPETPAGESDRRVATAPGAAERALEVLGYEAILWSDRGRTFALVGTGDAAELSQLAGHFRETSR